MVCESLLRKYEGNGKGKPYTGIYDDLRIVVYNLAFCMYNQEKSSINYLIDVYKKYPFIYDIIIDGNSCDILGDYNVSFRVIPCTILESFSCEYFNGQDLCNKCHYVTQRVLEDSTDNIYAITSLCVKTNYMFYFHSYIYDRNEGNVIDFSKRLIMHKEQFDMLFCYREINCLNYNEYKGMLNNSQYERDNDSMLPLIYLALEKLEKEDLDYRKKFVI